MFHVMSFFCCGLGDGRKERRPTTQIMVNGTNLQALWDTGADLTVASWAQFKKLKARPPLMRCTSVLTAANGQEIRARGVARLRFTIGRHAFTHDTVILDNLKTNMILGSDVMREHGFIINMGEATIKREEKPTLDKGMPTVTSPKSFKIESLQCVDLEIQVGGADGQVWLASGPHVPQGLCTAKAGKSRIIVANQTLNTIQIPRGQEICTLERISSHQMQSYLNQTTTANWANGQAVDGHYHQIATSNLSNPQNLPSPGASHVTTKEVGHPKVLAFSTQQSQVSHATRSGTIGEAGPVTMNAYARTSGTIPSARNVTCSQWQQHNSWRDPRNMMQGGVSTGLWSWGAQCINMMTNTARNSMISNTDKDY